MAEHVVIDDGAKNHSGHGDECANDGHHATAICL